MQEILLAIQINVTLFYIENVRYIMVYGKLFLVGEWQF